MWANCVNRLRILLTVTATLLIGVLIGSPALAAELVRPGEVIVILRKGISAVLSAEGAKIAAEGVVKKRTKGGLARVSLAAGAIQPNAAAKAVPYDKEYYDRICAQLKSSGAVERCSANFIVRASETPNDTYYSSLSGLLGIGAPSAWDLSTGSSAVTVAITDTGVDYRHADLEANMWINSAETPSNGIDDDGNGYVDDVYGINAITGSGNPMDDNGHGTHVAGTIGAVGNNSIGVAGVCWNVRLMALKFLDSEGSGDLYDAAAAIEYAVSNGAKVINASWGSYDSSEVLEAAIQNAGERGVLFVAAAGNDATNTDATPHYPSSYTLDNLISVAATDDDGALATSFSNFGLTSVDVGAPGVSILSTLPNDTYGSYSGTSMATPHVSGVAALILSYRSSLSVSQLRSTLLGTVTASSSLNGKVATGGVVNAAAALGASADLPEVPVYTLTAGALDRGEVRQGKKIRDRYGLEFEVASTSSSHTVSLDLKIGRVSCNVGTTTLIPGSTVTVQSRADKSYQGRASFLLYDDSEAQIASAVVRFAPPRSTGVRLTGRKLCKALARRIHLP